MSITSLPHMALKNYDTKTKLNKSSFEISKNYLYIKLFLVITKNIKKFAKIKKLLYVINLSQWYKK